MLQYVQPRGKFLCVTLACTINNQSMNWAIYSQCVQDLHAAKQYGNTATTTALLSTDLVINSVKLGEDDAINESRLGGVGVISQRLVELGQLVNCLIAH